MSAVLSWVDLLVRAFVIPALVSTAVLWPSPRRRWVDRVAGVLALAVGYFAGYYTAGHREGWAPLVPTAEKDEWSWLPWLAALAGLAGLAALLPLKRDWLRRGITALAVLPVAGAAAWLLVPDFETLRAVRPYYVGGGAAAVWLLWAALDPLAGRQPGGRLPLLLACVAVAAAVVILLAASLKLATLAGPLAGALAGCTVVGWRYPNREYLRGMLPGFAVLLVGLLLQGHLTGGAEVPLVCFLLVLVAPLLLWAGGRGRWGGWLQAAAVLLPLAAAVALAALSAEEGGGEEDWSAVPAWGRFSRDGRVAVLPAPPRLPAGRAEERPGKPPFPEHPPQCLPQVQPHVQERIAEAVPQRLLIRRVGQFRQEILAAHLDPGRPVGARRLAPSQRFAQRPPQVQLLFDGRPADAMPRRRLQRGVG
jgi:hypothetical protein